METTANSRAKLSIFGKTTVASIIRSGINGNVGRESTTVGISSISMTVASIIRSGINGNRDDLT